MLWPLYMLVYTMEDKGRTRSGAELHGGEPNVVKWLYEDETVGGVLAKLHVFWSVGNGGCVWNIMSVCSVTTSCVTRISTTMLFRGLHSRVDRVLHCRSSLACLCVVLRHSDREYTEKCINRILTELRSVVSMQSMVLRSEFVCRVSAVSFTLAF